MTKHSALTPMGVCVVLFLITGCAPAPVSWDDSATIVEAGDTASPVPETAGSLAPPSGFGVGDTVPPSAMGAVCVGSVRWTRAIAGDAYAVWWSPRANRSVVLVVSRLVEGNPAKWMTPLAADERDRGTRGCDRPPPAIALDSATGWVHMAYYLETEEGKGVYSVHSMEQGRMFHAPLPIVMGDHPVGAAIAVEGQTVVVAYEDPNTALPSVAVAVSGMGGHFFEPEHPTASPNGVNATAPRAAIRGGAVTVAWEETPRDSGGAGRGRLMLRHGEIHIPPEHVAPVLVP